MRVAVLSATRDRLAYTKHCFQTLRENAGCAYDHYVYDNASADGTAAWIEDEYLPHYAYLGVDNVGVSRAMNTLLDVACQHRYDVYVKFDNDCELLVPGTLSYACETVTARPDWILSPRILGLNAPPQVNWVTDVAGARVGEVGQIGGIFMAVPGVVFNERGYRHDPGNPTWGMDDVALSGWFRADGGHLGYLLDYEANHYETTDGQIARYPDYWERKKVEMGL